MYQPPSHKTGYDWSLCKQKLHSGVDSLRAVYGVTAWFKHTIFMKS